MCLVQKVRPAIIINSPHISQDVFIVPLTSKTKPLLSGEFILAEWKNVDSMCRPRLSEVFTR